MGRRGSDDRQRGDEGAGTLQRRVRGSEVGRRGVDRLWPRTVDELLDNRSGMVEGGNDGGEVSYQ